MKEEIVFATNNQNKLKEVREILSEKYVIRSLQEIGYNKDIPETADTLTGNAILKAQTIYEFAGLPVLADDTGLEIEFLEGRPGVYSARYAGLKCSAEQNMQKVLMEMSDTINRKAKFRTVIAYINNGNKQIFEGEVTGNILLEKKGKGGFGYDPIFQPDGYELSFAEMTPQQKNKISHRGRAVANMVNFLNRD